MLLKELITLYYDELIDAQVFSPVDLSSTEEIIKLCNIIVEVYG
jgi:hypothetical protein